jgi:multidrug efflux system membrane fusion protein
VPRAAASAVATFRQGFEHGGWLHGDGYRERRAWAPRAFSCTQSARRSARPSEQVMKARHLIAVGLVAAAGLWIASGHLLPHQPAADRLLVHTGDDASKKLFRVAVLRTSIVPHSRKLSLPGRTEADKRVVLTARAAGVLTDLRVKRGTAVQKNDIIAILSDEAREAQVAQAQAVLTQKRTELEAKRQLIMTGSIPRLQLVDMEAQLKAAEAAFAAAEAERERGVVRAPWSGVIQDVATEVGQAAFSFAGRELGILVALDPMLAVAEVAERKLAGIKVGDRAKVQLASGESASGKIRFVAKTASQTTRTYRVEIELPNPDGAIPDGITAELIVPQAPVPATRLPRSALTFSSGGDLGVRTVDADGSVEFAPISVVEDEQSVMWVAGLAEGSRVIVQGQDFVREGQKVEAVGVHELTAVAR